MQEVNLKNSQVQTMSNLIQSTNMNSETHILNQNPGLDIQSATVNPLGMNARLATSVIQPNVMLPIYVQPGALLVNTGYPIYPVLEQRILMI